MSSKESLPYPPSPTDQHDHPHICNSGWVSVGQMVVDDDGEETEEFAQYLCRRCAEAAKAADVAR